MKLFTGFRKFLEKWKKSNETDLPYFDIPKVEHLVDKKMAYTKEAERLNREIIKVQCSTKTLLPLVSPAHNYLRMRFRWYYKWHLWKYHRLTHALILLFYTLGIGLMVYSTLIVNPNLVHATNASITGTAAVGNTGSTLDFSATGSNVEIDDIAKTFSGYAWSTDLGWVAFGTADNADGPVSVNNTTHAVSGKAKVLNTGNSIDFNASPYNSNVTIAADGTFSGYAWSDDVGWIDFTNTSSTNFYYPPAVSTQATSSITDTTATSNGTVSDDSGSTVTDRGVYWTTDASAGHDCGSAAGGTKVAATTPTGTGTFTSNMSGLSPETYYCYRSYATNTGGTNYGSWVSFKTLATPVSSPPETTPPGNGGGNTTPPPAANPAPAVSNILTVDLGISKNRLSLKEGAKFQFSPAVSNPAGTAVTDAALVWSVKNPKVGQVTQTGLLTAGASGDYPSGLTVSATKGDLTGQTSLDLFISKEDPILTLVKTNPNSVTLAPGGQSRFTLDALDQNGSYSTPEKLGWTTSWSVSDPAAGTIDQTGLFTTKTTTGDYQKAVHARVTKGSDVRDVTARVVVTPEARILAFASMTNHLQIPSGSSKRYYTYGYDQFGSILGSNPTFSSAVPQAGNLDRTGLYTPKISAGCYDWIIDVSQSVNGATAHGQGRLEIVPAGSAKLERLREQYLWGISGYIGTVKPGGTLSLQAQLYNGLMELWPHTDFRFEMSDSSVGSITTDGFFSAGQTQDSYAQAIKITAFDTLTGEDKANYTLPIVVSDADPVLTDLTTAIQRLKPNSAAFSYIYTYDQFGLIMTDSTLNLKRFNVSDNALDANGGSILVINQYSGFFETSTTEGTYQHTFGGSLTHLGDMTTGLSVATNKKGYLDVASKYPLWCAGGNSNPPTDRPSNPPGDSPGGAIGDGDPNNPEIITKSPIDLVKPGSDLANDIIASESVKKPSILSRLTAKPSQNALISAVLALLVTAAAHATAPIASALTVLTLPEYFRALLFSILAVGSKKKRRQWGKVTEEGTDLPIPQTKIDLVRLEQNISGQDEGKVVETTYSDNNGNYAFVADPGRYLLDIHKGMYKVSAALDSYHPLSVITVSDPNDSLIIPSIVLTMESATVVKKTLSLRRSDLLERSMLYASIGFLLFGTIIVISGLIAHPENPANILITCMYPFLWYYNLLAIRRVSPFGDVLDRANYTGVPLALIRIMDRGGKRMIKTAITNKGGRFHALLSKGNYRMLVAKTGYKQPDPVTIDANEDLNTVNKRIEIEKNRNAPE